MSLFQMSWRQRNDKCSSVSLFNFNQICVSAPHWASQACKTFWHFFTRQTFFGVYGFVNFYRCLWFWQRFSVFILWHNFIILFWDGKLLLVFLRLTFFMYLVLQNFRHFFVVLQSFLVFLVWQFFISFLVFNKLFSVFWVLSFRYFLVLFVPIKIFWQ